MSRSEWWRARLEELDRWAVAILGVGLLVRLAGLGVELLWYDEAFTAYLVRLPFPNMMQVIAGDVHPPGHYLVVRAVAALLGRSALALRLPSVVFGALSGLLLYHLLRDSAGPRAGVIAGLLFALMPAQVNYAQEARPYAMAVWAVLLAARGVQTDRWIQAALGVALALYTLNLSVFYLAPLGVWALLKDWRLALRAFGAAGVCYLPWLPNLLGQAGMVGASYWLPPPHPGALLYGLLFSTFYVQQVPPLTGQVALVAVGLTVLALIALRRDLRELAFLLVMALLPPILMFAISLVWSPVFIERALLPAGAFLVGLWAAGIDRLRWQVAIPVGLVAVPALAISLGGYYTYRPVPNQFEFSEPMAVIDAGWQPGDVIYHGSLVSYIQLEYYRPGSNLLAAGSADLAQFRSDATRRALRIQQARLSDLPGRYRRVWVFLMETSADPDAGDFQPPYPVEEQYLIVDHNGMKRWLYLLDLGGE